MWTPTGAKLDYMSVTHSHQGVIVLAAVREYSTVGDIIEIAEERGETAYRDMDRFPTSISAR